MFSLKRAFLQVSYKLDIPFKKKIFFDEEIYEVFLLSLSSAL